LGAKSPSGAAKKPNAATRNQGRILDDERGRGAVTVRPNPLEERSSRNSPTARGRRTWHAPTTRDRRASETTMHDVRPDTPRLGSFCSARPKHDAAQTEAIDWLAQLHTAAERSRSSDSPEFDEGTFRERMRKLLRRYGCGPDKIARRGHSLDETDPQSATDVRIYDVTRDPGGAGSGARTAAFSRVAEEAMDRLYAGVESAPRDLVHVTCTGYASPSAAQRLVARRGWVRQTRVTHAYHMGCYASLPAVRIASGFLAGARASARDAAGQSRVDVVHNEVCTLHLQPADHSPEQLVVQTLFADGHVRYSVTREEPAEAQAGASLGVLSLREEIVPDSVDSMAWGVSDHGMRMGLSRDAPATIAKAAREFVSALFEEAGAEFPRDGAAAAFAIHPGGPKVIDVLQQALELSEAQVAASRDVLLRCGNMSSATLPHIWMRILEAPDVPVGSPVVSLAFGPGLTLSGAFMVKC
jgi:predicted naringenin-chalcone synthase